jgi:hypothetical protein
VAPAEVVQVSEAHELEPHHTHPHTGPCSPHSAPQNTTHTHTLHHFTPTLHPISTHAPHPKKVFLTHCPAALATTTLCC